MDLIISTHEVELEEVAVIVAGGFVGLVEGEIGAEVSEVHGIGEAEVVLGWGVVAIAEHVVHHLHAVLQPLLLLLLMPAQDLGLLREIELQE